MSELGHGEFEDHIMIALLPTSSEWSTIDLPHMTLTYCGKVSETSPAVHNDMLKVAFDVANDFHVITLPTLTRETFGPEDDTIDVLVLEKTQELQLMHARVVAFGKDKHPFNPHVTIGPTGSIKDKNPTYITFDRICVSWGEQNTIYPLLPI